MIINGLFPKFCYEKFTEQTQLTYGEFVELFVEITSFSSGQGYKQGE